MPSSLYITLSSVFSIQLPHYGTSPGALMSCTSGLVPELLLHFDPLARLARTVLAAHFFREDMAEPSSPAAYPRWSAAGVHGYDHARLAVFDAALGPPGAAGRFDRVSS